MRTDQVPVGARWWLHHGQPLDVADAEALGITQRDAWQTSLPHFAHATAPTSKFWTRADLRLSGYGAAIDQHMAAGRCPPDGGRKPGRAEVVQLDARS